MPLDVVVPAVIVAGTLGYIGWSIFDLSRYPNAAFEAVGESRRRVILRLISPFDTAGSTRLKLRQWQDDQQGITHEKRSHLIPSPVLAVINVATLIGLLYALGLWWDGQPTSALLVGLASVLIFAIIYRTLTERMRRSDY